MSEEVKRIAIWGPVGSGKTTFLAALVLELKNNYEKWHVQGFEDAVDFEVRVAADFSKGKFPDSTDFERPEEAKTIEYKMWFPRRFPLPDVTHEFRIIDIPGRLISGQGELSESYFDYLTECQGLLIMIDPEAQAGGKNSFGADESYMHSVTRLVNHLSQASGKEKVKISQYIAFCITKVDLDEHFSQIKDPVVFLKKIIGPHAWAAIANHCDIRNKVSVFCVSSVGRYETPSNHSRPNVVPAPASNAPNRYRVAVSNRKPMNVVEPILWMINKI